MLIDRLRKFDGRLLGFVGDVAGLRVEILANRFRMLPSRSYNEHGVVPALKPLLLSRGNNWACYQANGAQEHARRVKKYVSCLTYPCGNLLKKLQTI